MADLAHVLRHLPARTDPNLLVGSDLADDAAIYRISDDLALVQTVDFFTPVVDDPYTFGQIAAANSLSDVYAMGGTPLTALNIAGFPVGSLDANILGEVLRGGADKAAEAGVTIVGGHTVDDQEPKYGLAVTGTVHPTRFFTAHGARVGDVVVLTKPIGTGVIATALKRGVAEPGDVAGAVRWMATLNRSAAQALAQTGANAVTDVTGFGLAGHLSEMCRASGVAAELAAPAVPLLPGALHYARTGTVPGGTGDNIKGVEGLVQWDPTLDDAWMHLLADPQTSGGLLVTLPAASLRAFGAAMSADVLAAPIGRIVEGEAGAVTVVAETLNTLDH